MLSHTSSRVNTPARIQDAVFNREALEWHIRALHTLATRSGHQGQLILAAYGEDQGTGEKLPSRVQGFAIGDADSMIAAALKFERMPGYNVYAPLAIIDSKVRAGQRGTIKDIVCLLGAVLDDDVDAGQNEPVS